MKKIKRLIIQWFIRQLETELIKARVANNERQIKALEQRIDKLDGSHDRFARIYS